MSNPDGRIERRFRMLRKSGRAGLVTFITAGDPNLEQSEQILSGLADAGADLIELGMPFSDPMADGPAIQAGSLRALKAGHTMIKTLAMVSRYREIENDTPIILMGYYNPIHHYGVDQFVKDAGAAGVDGLIIVDLPREEDGELCLPAREAGINFIRLLTPTTSDKRLPYVLENTGGFLYYVSITGVTGSGKGGAEEIGNALANIAKYTDLPVAVGFGIKTPSDTAEMAAVADAVVVGTAIVERVAQAIESDDQLHAEGIENVLSFVRDLAAGVRSVDRANHN